MKLKNDNSNNTDSRRCHILPKASKSTDRFWNRKIGGFMPEGCNTLKQDSLDVPWKRVESNKTADS